MHCIAGPMRAPTVCSAFQFCPAVTGTGTSYFPSSVECYTLMFLAVKQMEGGLPCFPSPSRWMAKWHSEDRCINPAPAQSIQHFSALLLRAAFKHHLLSHGYVCQALIKSIFLGYFRTDGMREVSEDLSPKELHMYPAWWNQVAFCAYFCSPLPQNKHFAFCSFHGAIKNLWRFWLPNLVQHIRWTYMWQPTSLRFS